MKGAVFTIFQEMVEETFGFECWETLLQEANLPSGGIYTSADTYDDQEIIELVTALSNYTGTPVPDLVESFGGYLFPALAHSMPESMMNYSDLWSLLEAVDSVIHVEVGKLYPDAITPKLVVTEKTDQQLKMHYQSPRKLCLLAIGLIHKAAEKFGDTINISHECCMHEGSDHCILVITQEN